MITPKWDGVRINVGKSGTTEDFLCRECEPCCSASCMFGREPTFCKDPNKRKRQERYLKNQQRAS